MSIAWKAAEWRRRLENDLAWGACAARCDQCGRRRLTYQARDGFGRDNTDRLCAECFAIAFESPREPGI